MSVRNPLKVLTLSVLGCLVFGQATSGWARQDTVPGSRYTSARSAALGDAYLPIGDDGASGLFYNPAGLARIRQTTFEPANVQAYANDGFAATLASPSLNFYKATSLSSYNSTLQKYPMQHIAFGGALTPTFYTRGFAVGLLMQSQVGAR